MNKLPVLFFIIFLEGYVVLSTELLAIRQTIPFVGSGTDTVSIIIAAVLMPLAFGYYTGGRFRPQKTKDGGYISVRDKLIKNLIVSIVFLTFGLSYYVINSFFGFFIEQAGISNRFFLTSLYTILFIITPVYLLGQTVPLISNYFFRARLSEAAGRILLFSTIGSFCGAVISTLVLMNMIGVNGTAFVNILCLTLLVMLIAKRRRKTRNLIALSFLMAALILNSPAILSRLNIVTSNVYNTVQIQEMGKKFPVRILSLNRAVSSSIFIEEPERPLVYYRVFIENYFTSAMRRAEEPGKILVLGAGGFTVGLKDKINEYIFVDIDPQLKDITEEHFLGQKLGPNKTFIARPARAFLNGNKEKFDIIIMDVSGNITGTPEHLVTQEFFLQVRDTLKEDGVFFMNTFASGLFDDEYSRALDNTIRSVFPYTNRQIEYGLDIWRGKQKNLYRPVLYYSRKIPFPEDRPIYTDNKNTSAIDKDLSIRR